MRASDGPQVVIGVADVEPVSGETEVAPVSATSVAARAPTLEVVPEPSLSLVREPERLELVPEKNDEIVPAASNPEEPVEEIDDARAHEGAQAIDVARAHEGAQAIDVARAHATKDVPPASEERRRAHAPAPPADESVTPPPVEMAAPTSEKDPFGDADDASIPPVGNVDVEQFFSEGDVAAHAAGQDDENWDALEKAKRKHLPEVVARRSRYARYVRWAVGGAAVVCLAALVRTAFTPTAASVAASAPKGAAVTAIAAPELKAANVAPAEPAAEPKPAEAKADEAKADEAKPDEAKADEAKPDEAKAEQAKVEEPKTETAKTEEPKAEAKPPAADTSASAADAKKAAQRALESGRLDEAIAAGERAVSLDAGDGEAWLVLGASYQEKGRLADARRAYKACSEQGKRGPIGECRAMLR